MVVCQDYKYLLTGSSLVDYNNNDTVPTIFYHPIFTTFDAYILSRGR